MIYCDYSMDGFHFVKPAYKIKDRTVGLSVLI